MAVFSERGVFLLRLQGQALHCGSSRAQLNRKTAKAFSSLRLMTFSNPAFAFKLLSELPSMLIQVGLAESAMVHQKVELIDC